MSSRYAVGGKRKSSMVHASRTWACICGKTCRGNGGKSSHQRACRPWNEDRLATTRDRLAKTEADPSYQKGFYVLVDMAAARRRDIAMYEARLAAIAARDAKKGGS